MWPLLLAACCLAAIPFWWAGFGVETGFLLMFVQGPAIGFAAVRLLQRNPATYAIAGALEGIFLLSFTGLFGVLTCYAAATAGAPTVDAELLWLDRALGYDWAAYAHFCATKPWLLQAFRYSYNTILIQPVLVGFLLYGTRRGQRFERFVVVTMIAETLSAALFLFFPATTAWTYLGQEHLAAHILPDLPITTNSWLADLLQIRSGGGRHLTGAAGIVAFPSFHCAAGLLNIWAIWPIRRMRLPFLAVNLTMIAATPLIGGHYLTDLIGGAAVAWVSVLAGPGLHRRLVASKLMTLPAAWADRLAQIAPRWPQRIFAK